MVIKRMVMMGLMVFFLSPLCIAGEFEDLKKRCGELPDGEALGICERCLALNPDDGQVNWLLGRIYSRRGDNETSLPYFEKAAELSPDSVLANFTLAFAYESASSDPTRAHAVYERILSLDPDPDPVDPQERFILKTTYRGLGNSYYYDREDYNQALIYYQKAYAVGPESFICEKIASTYQALGDYANELEWRNEAIALDDADSGHYSLRGKAFFNLGEKEKALADYNKAIQLDPAQPYPYSYIARLYADQKETIPEAIRYYELAYDRYADENQKTRTKEMIDDLKARLTAPPGVEEMAANLGLPTDRDEFEKLLENHKYEIDNARYDFEGGNEAKAYETLNAIRETQRRLSDLNSALQNYNYRSPSDFAYYIRQASSHIGTLTAWYEKVQADHESKKEKNRINLEKAPGTIAQRYKDVTKPDNYKYILKTLGRFQEWKVVTDFRETYDSPFVRLGGPTDDIVFDDLPLDVSSFRKRPLVIHARITRQMEDRYVISNYLDKEALADIPKKIAAESTIKYGEYYRMVCSITDIVSVATVIGSQKPVALVKVDGIISDDAYRQFARYVAGHPDEFPYQQYLVIENIVQQ